MPPIRSAISPVLGLPRPLLVALTALSAVLSGPASCQIQIQPAPGSGVPVAPADPAIADALARISPDDIRADILKLVSFGNRSTLSSMDKDLPPGKGVTAAADWIFDEFTRISAACGNCLEVHRDDFIEPASTEPGSRIKQETRIQNIYAILPGTDPAQRPRRVLVTGHYDSRTSDNFDTHNPAPGANDDASGVAVSLESARTLIQAQVPRDHRLRRRSRRRARPQRQPAPRKTRQIRSLGPGSRPQQRHRRRRHHPRPVRTGAKHRPHLLRGRPRPRHARPTPRHPDSWRGERLTLPRARPSHRRSLRHLLQTTLRRP